MRYRLITFLVFGAILIGIGEWDFFKREVQPLQNLNDWWLEFCVAQAPDQITDPAVTFIRITDDYEPLDLGLGGSEPAEDGPKKLTRLDYATILGALQKLNPKSVAFAPVPDFDSKSMFNQTDIEPLKDAALPLPRMTLGAVVSGTGENDGLEYPALAFTGDISKLPEIKRTVKRPDKQLLVNGDPAFTHFEEDSNQGSEGIIHVPIVARQGEKVVPSFILHAFINHSGLTIDEVVVGIANGKGTVTIGERFEIPIDSDGSMRVPSYSGVRTKMVSDRGKETEQHHFSTLTVDQIHIPGEQDDVVARDFISKFQRELDSISQNLVLIGFDRNIDRRFKLKNGDQFSRAGLNARAIATIQSGRFIDWWPYWLRCLVIAAVLLFSIWLLSFYRHKSVFLSIIGALAIIALLVFSFTLTLSWTPPFSILALLVLLIIVAVILPNTNEPKPRDVSHEFDDEVKKEPTS